MSVRILIAVLIFVVWVGLVWFAIRGLRWSSRKVAQGDRDAVRAYDGRSLQGIEVVESKAAPAGHAYYAREGDRTRLIVGSDVAARLRNLSRVRSSDDVQPR
jgi:hypothetical protein